MGLAAAWQVYQGFRAVPGVGLLFEPPACDDHLATVLNTDPQVPARLAADAWLAALANAASLRLVSFDSDFRCFPLRRCRILPGTTK